MAEITLRSLTKDYGTVRAVHGIDLDISNGEFVVLVGPSGCGKSTTLRMLAGLEDISGGELRIAGRLVNDAEPKARNIAMVFQNYAIYPHLTVAQNIAFGLYTSGMSRAQKDARVAEVAGMLGLTDYLARRPAALSGGQRQRVAIGRAMVRDPVAFLFDEPLSNLDAQLRAQMRIEIKRLHQRLGTTIVYVTHDQVEAMTMADRIVVMRDGHILQVGAPVDLYENPVDLFTARFIGNPSMNVLDARVQAGRIIVGDQDMGACSRADGAICLGIRPQDLLVDGPGTAARINATVTAVEPLGPETLVHLDAQGHEVMATAPGRVIPAIGSTLTASADAGRLYLFDPDSQRALGRA
ncbi:ABC transporter ATP-binding protein [Roseinatronobacter alkalisoli]|uniref:Sn-glycerol-3-phosphate ABC transporter ATP-binding protein UgpC n=1 Tax=Roseinatronobacter alkalisoli TaxID=3028235 RepID=A0ABT5TD45_9RHOB|nr:sn-glycerol-3-phosphate ABC transporter ATP-binding protein UgpC [Roseinatronobacter sp. HJB301]MDD7973045.1 sn-glycerol-3-phosphate ABC transporter ATP-binding protein UgpC [Roseinatronobacter sp. HJB301]